MYLYSFIFITITAKTTGKSGEGSSEERRNSSSDNNDTSAQKMSKTTDSKKDKSEKKGGKKKAKGPPVEAFQPPPGPLVALGKPKVKALKRPRSVSCEWLVHYSERDYSNSVLYIMIIIKYVYSLSMSLMTINHSTAVLHMCQ